MHGGCQLLDEGGQALSRLPAILEKAERREAKQGMRKMRKREAGSVGEGVPRITRHLGGQYSPFSGAKVVWVQTPLTSWVMSANLSLSFLRRKWVAGHRAGANASSTECLIHGEHPLKRWRRNVPSKARTSRVLEGLPDPGGGPCLVLPEGLRGTGRGLGVGTGEKPTCAGRGRT